MNIGIIGCGIQGTIRFNAIRDIDSKYRVTKVSDVYKPDFLRGHKDVEFTKDYNEIIDDGSIDAVFACAPNYINTDIVIKSLNKGKHVFCEKPPGRNLEETELMIEAEKNNPKCKLMFGFNHRHHESLLHAKEVISSGRLGKILWMRGRYGKSVKEGFCNSWRAKKKLAGGGIFLDQGIHMLDLFLMMVKDFDEVKSYVSNLYWDLDIEDNVFAIFKNSKGQVASLHSTMTQWRHLFSFEIFLEKGHVVINGLLTTSGSYGQEELSIAEICEEGPSASWDKEEKRKYNINTSWDSEIKMFFRAIENNTPIPVGSSNDAYKLMRLVDKVYREGG